MSIFGNIMGKIFGNGHAQSRSAPSAPADPAPSAAPAAAPAPTAAPAPASAPAAQPVDVGAVLAEMANAKGGGGNYKVSIVDLLRLLDLDSSLEARKELADELGVHAGEPGTAEQNIALHKAVIAKLAENGGIVPDSLRG
ncbi:DUF3597 domain-containing protein [Sphingomonas sp. AP4-R1]|uniref:DUF3597 domain-containing protein n=1 Tax=Sphingomonas sp. AP4-R1 TaxID=2735134 RepID=UPI001493BA95|nr:DUF3597 domain-containing protein [Sphingomonas sp. AP4-R1]QJU60930.1 DUF3597 domain-containing protein [Sphingomonas sp. AP4-R1]